MAQKEVGAVYVTDMLNVRWLSGFTGSSGAAIVTPDHALFITDSRYTIQAQEQVRGLELRTFGSPQTMDGMVGQAFSDFGIRRIWFETSLSYSAWEGLVKAQSGVEWIAQPSLFPDLRMIKTADEVARIRKACELADACMGHAARMLQPGVAEYDIYLDIEFFLKRNGAQPAFEPIVVSGPNSARPHGRASDRQLQRGDFVTLDLGAQLDGYNSDITRTFVIGEASDRHVEIYNQVLKAEKTCCEALVVGAHGKAVDQLAREILDEKGLAKHFGHGLGHGLGMNVHDYGSLSTRSTNEIMAGQVWTVEPGVYIEGFGGVRIEDDVLVTESGPEILTHYPKELTVVS